MKNVSVANAVRVNVRTVAKRGGRNGFDRIVQRNKVQVGKTWP